MEQPQLDASTIDEASSPTRSTVTTIRSTAKRAANTSHGSGPRILLVGPMPPTKGGITTFILNLMNSYLKDDFEFVPYNITRPPKRDVIDNWGYSAVLRGGLVRI